MLYILPVAGRLLQGPPSPEALQYFSGEQIQRARELARANIIPGSLVELASLGALFWLCLARSGRLLLQWLEGPSGRRLWFSALAVTAGAVVLSSVAALPFELILFQIATAHGLTVQSLGNWLGDWGKSLLVDLVQVPLAALPTYYLMRRWPRTWWIGGATVVATVVVFMNMIYPTFIAPLFDQILPVRDPQVLAMVDRLANQTGVKVGEVRLVTASAKTTTINAQVQGFGPTKRVVIWDTMIQQLTPDELEVILAHELGHAARNDVAVLTLAQAAILVLEVYLLAMILHRMTAAGSAELRQTYPPRVIAVALLLVALLSTVTAPGLNTLSRALEVRADLFSLEQTRKPEAFVAAMAKGYATNRSDPEPPVFGELLRLAHPSPMARIRMGLAFRKP